MKLNPFIIAFASLVSLATSSFAGGGACTFSGQGQPVVNESPVLAKMLGSSFTIAEFGVMGPIGGPMVDGRRFYSYMDYRATSVDNPEQLFLIRVHFHRDENRRKFDHLEIFPVAAAPGAALETFRDIYNVIEASVPADGS